MPDALKIRTYNLLYLHIIKTQGGMPGRNRYAALFFYAS